MSSITSKLRPYQIGHARQLLQALVGYRAALDGSDTGTGKTYVALTCAKALNVVPLVICLRSLIPSWQRVADLIETPVEVVNYEKVRMPNSRWGELIPHGKGSYWRWHTDYSAIFFDEVQVCGGMSTINSKLLKAAKRQAQYVLGMSATAAESPLQLNALGFALGLHNGKDFFKWLMRYGCKPGVFGGMTWTGDPEEQRAAMARLNGMIYPKRGARMRKADIPGFPKTQIEAKLVGDEKDAQEIGEMLESLRQQYEEAPTMLLNHRIQQDLELRLVPHAVELTKLYGETSKVAIFCNYTATIDELQHQLWDAYGRMWTPGIIDGRQVGDKGLAERTKIVRRFQENQEPALLLNAQSGGPGINLHDPIHQVERTTLVFPMYSGKTLDQVFGRVNRDGGGFSQQFLLGFAGTLHERIFLTVLQKRENLSVLNDGIFYGQLT
jgi:hypothetical protein